MTHTVLVPSLVSLAAVLVLTPATCWLARRVGMVAAPRPDRWHAVPTALLGGVPIFVGFSLALTLTRDFGKPVRGVILGSLCVFALGLVDDVFQLKPFPKLVGVIVASGIVVCSGLYLPWFPWMSVNFCVTMLWLVGITNAMNLLDNMDGLASGIAVIASIFVGLSFFIEGKSPQLMLAGIFAGAVAGFLVYNFSPASIFMGDCGSMFLGFFLAGLTLMSGFGRSRNLLYVLAGPVLPFLTPIFDTTFVTISRLISGRPVSLGGRDHTSHRLANVAGSERNAVLIFYGFAIVSGFMSLFVRLGHFSVSFALIPILCLVLAFFGVYLGQVNVAIPEVGRDHRLLERLQSLLVYNGIFQVGVDLLLILISYYSALLLRFEGNIPPGDLKVFFMTIPWFIIIKVTVFIALGAYRDLWKYFGIASLLVYAKAIALSSTICMLALLFANRFAGFSRAVFITDAIVLLFLVAATRMSFQIFKTAIRKHPAGEQNLTRALIYGADEIGMLLAKELEDHSALGYMPVGFIDDDPGSGPDRSMATRYSRELLNCNRHCKHTPCKWY